MATIRVRVPPSGPIEEIEIPDGGACEPSAYVWVNGATTVPTEEQDGTQCKPFATLQQAFDRSLVTPTYTIALVSGSYEGATLSAPAGDWEMTILGNSSVFTSSIVFSGGADEVYIAFDQCNFDDVAGIVFSRAAPSTFYLRDCTRFGGGALNILSEGGGLCSGHAGGTYGTAQPLDSGGRLCVIGNIQITGDLQISNAALELTETLEARNVSFTAVDWSFSLSPGDLLAELSGSQGRMIDCTFDNDDPGEYFAVGFTDGESGGDLELDHVSWTRMFQARVIFDGTSVGHIDLDACALVTTGVGAGVVPLDWSYSNQQQVTLTESGVASFINIPTPSATLTLDVTQDGTGGWTITFPGVTWLEGFEPSADLAPNALTRFLFTRTSGGVVGQRLAPVNIAWVQGGNFGAAPDLNFKASLRHTGTLDANAAFTFGVAPPDGGEVFIKVTDTVGGHTMTWPANVKWLGGAAPPAQAAGTTSIIKGPYELTTDTYWLAFLPGYA